MTDKVNGGFYMKKAARLVLSIFGLMTIVFLYQNCGTKGEIFGNCTTQACASQNPTLFIDPSDSGNGAPSGTPLTLGKIDGQEIPGAQLDYKNIDFEGSCGAGPYSRHVIRWTVACTLNSDCQMLTPKRGTSLCYDGRFQIKDYVRGVNIPANATQTGFGRYTLKMEIVGLDSYFNDIPGDANSRAEYPLNFVKTIQAPSLLSFGGDLNYTLPIVPVTNGLLYQGLCDYSTNPIENVLTLRFALANSGFTAGGGVAASDMTCINRDGSGVGSPTRTGYFDRTIANITAGSLVSPPFNECTNCLENILSRLVEFTLSQTDLIGAQSITIRNKKLFQFKNNDLYLGKGWSVETMREITRRANKALGFQVTTDTTIPSADYARLSGVIRPTTYVNLDEEPSGTSPILETESFRRYVLYKMGQTELIRKYISTDLTLQASDLNDYFRTKLKTMASGVGFCESLRTSGIITGVGVEGDAELHRVALCLTRYFYYGLHNVSNDITKKLTMEGLNYSSAGRCSFQGTPDGSVGATAAPNKFCILVKQFLSNYSEAGSAEYPVNPNSINTNNKLTAMKSKFLSGTSIVNTSITSENFKLFGSAVAQMYTNAIMAEVSRHAAGGVAASFFMEDVLDEIYQRNFEAYPTYHEGSGSYVPATKIALYNLLSPNEVNYAGGSNNFSAYSTRREAGSVKATGSIDCRLVTASNGAQQCNP